MVDKTMTDPIRQWKITVCNKPNNMYYRATNQEKFFRGGCPHGAMIKAMDCGIVVSEFVLESRYYVHFQAITLGEGMNPLILLSMR